MSSAAGGFLRSFSIDRGSTLPWTDLHETDCLFIAGTTSQNVIRLPCSVFGMCKKEAVHVIVVDPRETALARRADVHLDLKPGTDLALANGIFKLIDHKWSC